MLLNFITFVGGVSTVLWIFSHFVNVKNLEVKKKRLLYLIATAFTLYSFYNFYNRVDYYLIATAITLYVFYAVDFRALLEKLISIIKRPKLLNEFSTIATAVSILIAIFITNLPNNPPPLLPPNPIPETKSETVIESTSQYEETEPPITVTDPKVEDNAPKNQPPRNTPPVAATEPPVVETAPSNRSPRNTPPVAATEPKVEDNAPSTNQQTLDTPPIPIEGVSYSIQSANGSFLHVENGNQEWGTPIVTWNTAEGKESKFYFEKIKDNEYRIRTALADDLYLEISDSASGSDDYDANVQLIRWLDGYDCKIWLLEIHEGYFMFVNKKYQTVIDIEGNRTENGTRVRQYHENQTDAQLFTLIPEE